MFDAIFFAPQKIVINWKANRVHCTLNYRNFVGNHIRNSAFKNSENNNKKNKNNLDDSKPAWTLIYFLLQLTKKHVLNANRSRKNKSNVWLLMANSLLDLLALIAYATFQQSLSRSHKQNEEEKKLKVNGNDYDTTHTLNHSYILWLRRSNITQEGCLISNINWKISDNPENAGKKMNTYEIKQISKPQKKNANGKIYRKAIRETCNK